MISYSRPQLSDFYTLFEGKLTENHTLHSGTYLYSSYMGVPPPPPPGTTQQHFDFKLLIRLSTDSLHLEHL